MRSKQHYIGFVLGLCILGASIQVAAQTNAWIEPLEEEFALAAARAVCYSALTGNTNHSVIVVPLPNNGADLDGVCHNTINGGWHAGGVAKGNYFYQNCPTDINNRSYGGGYTSYVTEAYFESNRSNYSSCGPYNAFICCSPQFVE
jgi:hypothetical protein